MSRRPDLRDATPAAEVVAEACEALLPGRRQPDQLVMQERDAGPGDEAVALERAEVLDNHVGREVALAAGQRCLELPW